MLPYTSTKSICQISALYAAYFLLYILCLLLSDGAILHVTYKLNSWQNTYITFILFIKIDLHILSKTLIQLTLSAVARAQRCRDVHLSQWRASIWHSQDKRCGNCMFIYMFIFGFYQRKLIMCILCNGRSTSNTPMASFCKRLEQMLC